MILVSSCLLGMDARYNGSSEKDEILSRFLSTKKFIPFCPEQLGGLSTPRNPVELKFVGGRRRVFDEEGNEFTDNFQKGLDEIGKLVEMFGISHAILKEKSPSCGSNLIYDGSFSGKTIEGKGLAAEYLESLGVQVISNEDLSEAEILKIIDK